MTIDTDGHCCWAGQVWSVTRSACVGPPDHCPAGMVAGESECVSPPRQPAPTASRQAAVTPATAPSTSPGASCPPGTSERSGTCVPSRCQVRQPISCSAFQPEGYHRAEPRNPTLVSREVAVLQRLVSRGSGSAQHAAILHRLAGAQSELGEREAAIRSWATLIREDPGFAAMDEVLYRLGAALSAIERHEPARQVFHRLVQAYPQSPFVPAAMLAFVEGSDARTANRVRERALTDLDSLLRASPSSPRACEWAELSLTTRACIQASR